MVAATALVAVALVPAAAPTATAQETQSTGSCVPEDDPYDVSLVLDRSGSMSGDPIRESKEGAIRLLQNLTPNDQSGLVSYSTGATLDDPLSFDHKSTAEAVADLSAGGTTATGDAIDLSHKDLDERGRDGANRTMVLLSDGKTNTGLDPVEQAEQAKADGVEIFVIGLGSGIDETELKAIASDPVEDHYFTASTADDVVGVFEDLGGVLTVPTPYAGEAYGVQADVVSDDPYSEAHTPETPHVTEVRRSASAASVTQQAGPYTVSFSTANLSVDGDSGPDNVSSTSMARIQGLAIEGPSGTLVEADALRVHAHAWSSPADEAVASDGLQAAELRAQGTEVAPSVPPNTVVPLPGVGTVTLNEKVETQHDGNVTLRVNAVHLEVDDGTRSGDVVVGSAYAAASCTPETSFDDPDAGALDLDTVDEEVSAGPATANPGECAEDEVAVSGTGCSQGEVAVSGTEEARNTGDGGDCRNDDTCVAASGTGDAQNADDDCQGSVCVAASGTGDAQNVGDDCSGSACVAASGTGDALSAGDDCRSVSACAAASGTGHAEDIEGTCFFPSPCVAASGTGDADAVVAAVSGTGNARSVVLAASGAGYAQGFVAVTGTGTATGTVAAGVTGTCNHRPCNHVNATGPAEGHNTAVSGNGSADARQGAAVSGTGPAHSDVGAAASGTGSATTSTGVAASGTGPAHSDLGAAASGTKSATTSTGVAASGTGPAHSDLGAAASGTDHANGTVAFTGTGSAEGSLLTAGLTGTCNGRPCNTVNATGPAEGHNTAVSGNGSADARQGAAVSGTGPAHSDVGAAASGTGSATTSTGVAASGCTGAGVYLFGSEFTHVDSPAPVCQAPTDGSGSLLP